MIDLLIVLAIYSVLILIFVPLERIGRAQTAVKKHLEKLIEKARK